MKEELEFIHNEQNSKVWSIEKKGKKIYIKFGKKGAKLQEKEYTFKTEEDATDEYKKKIKEKLNKGYDKINKLTTKKSTQNKLNISTVNLFIHFLENVGNKIGSKMYELQKEYRPNNEVGEKQYYNDLTIFYNKKYGNIDKQIEKFQNKNIMPFLKSGIIVKKMNNKIKENLLKNINIFSSKKNPDYHPGSDNKVLDIVHPSLYPLIQSTAQKGTLDFWNRPYEKSKYQWLPSEFKIDKDGKCKIESYINNLPITETLLYENIEKLFDIVLPEFENIWSYSNTFEFYNGDWLKKPANNGVIKKIELRNRNLQVITKIVKISLKNKEDLLGAWHVEGMSHENIVATATYTLEQDDNFDASIYFKRMYSYDEVDSISQSMPQYPPPELSKLLHTTLVPLGKVKINENSLIIFPNSHVHKIDMKTTSKSEQSRTIIVFWLINPNIRITSTKDIKQQNYSLSKAHEVRLELMKERTYHKQTFNQRELNLCEH